MRFTLATLKSSVVVYSGEAARHSGPKVNTIGANNCADCSNGQGLPK
jgi:hypothetical protein